MRCGLKVLPAPIVSIARKQAAIEGRQTDRISLTYDLDLDL